MSVELYDDPALDRALARGLSALAPEVEAVDATLAELRPSFHRARTRRRVVRASAALAALLLVGSAALAQAPGARRAHVTVEAPDRRIAPTTVPKLHTSPRTHPRATAPPKPTTIPATSPPSVSSAPSTSTASSSPQRIAVLPPSPSSAATAPTQTTAPRRTAPASVSLTYWATGGHIDVRFAHGRLALTGVYPAKGYQTDVRVARADRIDVRFTRRGRWADSEIELDVVNGHIVRTDSNSGSWPMSGISSVSPPPGHRLAFHPAHSSSSSTGGSAGRGAAHLLAFRTVLSQHGAKIAATHARPSGKHAAPLLGR